MQKSSIVICINDQLTVDGLTYFDKPLVKGELYVIREIMPSFMGTIGKPGLMLEEIKGKRTLYHFPNGSKRYVEYHFRIDRFAEVLPPASLELLATEDIKEPVAVLI